MRVMYKKTIADQINDIIYEAENAGQEIEMVILTDAEWNLFVKQRNLPTRYYHYTHYNGVRIHNENYK